MKNKIGIVGVGVVGDAVKYGMEKLGHIVKVYDIKYEQTSLNDVIDTDICFICVPTPTKNKYECDTSIVEKIVDSLTKLEYQGIIAIKSTVPPTTTKTLQDKYNNDKICFVPEFLRERCAIADFTQNHDLCVIGTDSEETFNFIKKIHGKYPENFVKLNCTEAEFVKYYNNIYNASLIILANNFYEICKKLNINYDNVKQAIVMRKHINDCYLDCNENFRGYAGACLPKDVKTFVHLSQQLDIDAKMFEFLDNENKKYKPTVFQGMRK
jgi:UDPglucose 6-dehydrogenase